MSSRPKKTTPPSTPDPNLESWRPRKLGPYTILKVLGEGGMGTVYLAEQFEPIRRHVALKLIKLGQDTKEVLARFEQERQALSMMNHPSIAKVFDAGAADDGRPYFVMEFADGIRITQYCDEQRLSIPKRLELFMDVCAGVQHAHQKGIIHRDLKPSNILVTVGEGHAVPKIIDFGLALATEQKLTEQTLFTRQGQWIGTPEYMSPEQAGAGTDIDTRADIYSLGVVLYELLTGHLPFESWMLREAGLAEIQRTIQEEEPPKPSTKVSTTGHNDELAEVRCTDPTALRKRLRGDLDWIVMRALEKDRTRRYASASELAADITRHLNHEPALAGPPSWGYRTRKFLRRHRIQVTAAAAVVLSLIAGIIIAVSQYRRAESNLTLATKRGIELEKQKLAAQEAAERAQKSAAEAKKSAELANTARERMAEQRRIAVREAHRAGEMLRKFKFLSYVTRLERAKEEAARLYPAWPQNEEALREWMHQGRLLQAELPKIRTTIGQIDSGIRSKESSLAREFKGRIDDLERSRERLKDLVGSTLISEAVGLFGDLQETEARARLRLFEEIWIEQFLRDALVELIDDMRSFGRNEFADVRNRLFWATRIERVSIDDHAAAWRRATASAADPEGPYRGLDLPPQIGLVPLGSDPESGLLEFVHLRSAARTSAIPDRDPATGRLRLTPQSGIVFVLIPGATFTLGAQKSDPEAPGYDPKAQPDEQPLRDVTLGAFFLAKHEVTQAQWTRLAKRNPSAFRGSNGSEAGTAAHPVENVSWSESREILRRHGLLLPTEAQWEYAATCGKSLPWPSGETESSLAGAANLADAWFEKLDSAGWVDGHAQTAPAAHYRANAFGLHDLCGNVAEWCRDREGPYSGPMRDGDGLREHAAARTAIVRGGSFRDPGSAARCKARASFLRDNRSEGIGVRAAREILR